MKVCQSISQPRKNVRNSFAATCFLSSPPQLARRCPGFDNDCPEFGWGERPREPRRPEPKTFRPAFGNDCPDFDSRRPDFQNCCPELVNRCPGFFRHCPEFQTLAPFLKATAPISWMFRLFFNLLPVSNLHKLVGTARCAVRSSQRDDPTITLNLELT
jgi:hypothetical protein